MWKISVLLMVLLLDSGLCQTYVSLGQCQAYNPQVNSCGTTTISDQGASNYMVVNTMSQCPQGFVSMHMQGPNSQQFCTCQQIQSVPMITSYQPTLNMQANNQILLQSNPVVINHEPIISIKAPDIQIQPPIIQEHPIINIQPPNINIQSPIIQTKPTINVGPPTVTVNPPINQVSQPDVTSAPTIVKPVANCATSTQGCPQTVTINAPQTLPACAGAQCITQQIIPAAQAILQSCSGDLFLPNGYYCSNGIITQSLPLGAACSGLSNFECQSGFCNSLGRCDTFVNSYSTYALPVLQGANQYGILPCQTNSQCSYQVNGAIVSAASLGLGCLPTLYAPTQSYNCQLGGGEPIFNQVAQYVTSYTSLYI
jgi:hypothetical protein